MKKKFYFLFAILLFSAGSVWSQGPINIPVIIHPTDSIEKPKSPDFNSLLTTVTFSTRNFGVLCYNSAINMRNHFGSAADYILLKWNYFGDPSLAVIPNEYVLEK